ncbi:MAG: class I SAM-dependent methyltransferase [Candidatus Latescibacterota bacterium]
MTLSAARFLLSPPGREIAAAVRNRASDPLAAGRFLRREHPEVPPEHLAAAVELAQTRERARGKFDHAGEMFFTREALEQASDRRVAAHRAERFRGLGNVMDACSGIGGDAIALGNVAERLTCVDCDPARLLFCGENLRVHGIEARLVQADVLELKECLGEYDALFIDPSRRPGGKRTLDVLAMEPPLDRVEELLSAVPRGAAKLPTSVRPQDISIPHELEWVSLEDGLKEATLWTGGFRRGAVSVSLLHRGAFLRDADLPLTEPEVGEPGAYLHEPDPALIRSGLLGRKAASLGMRLLDREIAYTFTDQPVQDPFFDSYRVRESMPFNLKRLNAALNAMDAGRVTIKKRGFPLLPEEVIRKLKLKGSGNATVVLSRRGGEHLALIVDPLI